MNTFAGTWLLGALAALAWALARRPATRPFAFPGAMWRFR